MLVKHRRVGKKVSSVGFSRNRLQLDARMLGQRMITSPKPVGDLSKFNTELPTTYAVSFDLSRAPRLYRERVQHEHLGGCVKHYNRYSRSPK